MNRWAAALLLAGLSASSVAAECFPFADAPKHVGETVCIAGTVVKIGESKRSGTHFLNFCEDYKGCPFSVVVFSRDLDQVGDVNALLGKKIEIHGRIKKYEGQAEMVLSDAQQLRGEMLTAPPLDHRYDASNEGHGSAGSAYPKKAKKAKKVKPTGDQPVESEPQ